MITHPLYFNLSSITQSTSTVNTVVTLKGISNIQFILTGIAEDYYKAMSIDINWGDYSPTEYYGVDLVKDYKNTSIFDEILYGKVGGSIMTSYNHTYKLPVSTFGIHLTAQCLVYFNNGNYASFFQPITLIKESYYDDIKQLNILNTQIQRVSSTTFVNLESKFNKQTYIALLNKN